MMRRAVQLRCHSTAINMALSPSEQSIEAIINLVTPSSSSTLASLPANGTSSSGLVQPFQSAIVSTTSIHTNLAVEDELHRRLVFASVADLVKEHEGLLMASASSSLSPSSEKRGGGEKNSNGYEPFAMSNLPAANKKGDSQGGAPSSSSAGTDTHRCLSLLLSYINGPCVVIGRNQNPWQETNFRGIGDTHYADMSMGTDANAVGSSSSSPSLSPADGVGAVDLARRSSGGGAVYHDLGNVCFSFLTHRTLYDPARSVEVLRRYLLCRLAPYVRDEDLTTTKRNDLFLFGHKITGSAMKVTSKGCYHHLTLLVASSRPDLGRYLTKHHQWEWCVSAGVDSVRSRVTTLAIALRGLIMPSGATTIDNGAGVGAGDGKNNAGRVGAVVTSPTGISAAVDAKYPQLVPSERLLAAKGHHPSSAAPVMSPFERFMWLASTDAPFVTGGSGGGADDGGSAAPITISAEALAAIRAMAPHDLSRLVQRDFCRYYAEGGGAESLSLLSSASSSASRADGVTAAAAAAVGGPQKKQPTNILRGGEGQLIPYLFLSQAVVAPKTKPSTTSAEGDGGAAAEAGEEEYMYVPFASSEFSGKKKQLLSIFGDVFKGSSSSSGSGGGHRDIPIVTVDTRSHLDWVKRRDAAASAAASNSSDESSSASAPKRSANQRLSDPRSLAESLRQQQSRVWLLKNTPKFTTLVRIPAYVTRSAVAPSSPSEEGATATAAMIPKSRLGWTQWLEGGDAAALPASSLAATAVPHCASYQPDIIIRTQVGGGGVIESIRCGFDYREENGSGNGGGAAAVGEGGGGVPSPSSQQEKQQVRADVSEAEADGVWFSEAMGILLQDKALRVVATGVGGSDESADADDDVMGPFPPRPRFGDGLEGLLLETTTQPTAQMMGAASPPSSPSFTPADRDFALIAMERSLKLSSAFIVGTMPSAALVSASAAADSNSPALAELLASVQLSSGIAVGSVASSVSRMVESELGTPVNPSESVAALFKIGGDGDGMHCHDLTADDIAANTLAAYWFAALVRAWEERSAW